MRVLDKTIDQVVANLDVWGDKASKEDLLSLGLVLVELLETNIGIGAGFHVGERAREGQRVRWLGGEVLKSSKELEEGWSYESVSRCGVSMIEN